MRALATLFALFPIAVLADDASSPPRWSLGAGISTTVIYTSNTGGGIAWSTSQPSAGASLERRLTETNWLVLAVDGTIGESQQEFSSPPGSIKSELRRLSLNLGLRHLLTRTGAPVDVSVLALATGGYSEQNRTSLTSLPGAESSSWLAGGNVGVAIDRQLTEGLSLRIATPLVGVWWEKTRQEASGVQLDGHSLFANVYLQPRLELRLAF